MEWLSLFFSAVAALSGVIGAMLGYRVFQMNRSADLPTVSIQDLQAIPEIDGRYKLWFTVQNRSSVNWEVESVEILKPAGSGVASLLSVQASRDTRFRPDMADHEPEDHEFAPKQVLQRRVEPFGSKGQPNMVGTGDTHRDTLIIQCPSSQRDNKLSIRFTLASSEANQRRIDRTINRTAPAAPKMATA